jgi:hypothetical protein
MTVPDEGAIDYFRHPDYQIPKNFHRSYDYYSLGVVLAAIGWTDPVESLAKKFRNKQPENANNPKKWAEFLLDRVERSLGSRCGRVYKDVVVRCLRGDFGMDENSNEINRDSSARDWQKAFLFHVVQELVKCAA